MSRSQDERSSGEAEKEDCRRVLGEEHFEHVENELGRILARKPKIDRGDVYRAITEGILIRDAFTFLGPEWIRKRDKALDDIWQAIQKFKAVLREAPLVRNTDDITKVWAGGLEREYRRIVEPPEGGLTYMKLKRSHMKGVQVGSHRPRAMWRHETVDKLRSAGLSITDSEALVDAAGLSEKTPSTED